MKSKERTDSTGEVFTPLSLVNEALDRITNASFDDETYIDPACGNGNFLIEIYKRNNNLNVIYGVDLMADNVCDTIARLQIYALTREDPFKEDGSPANKLIDYQGHHDDHSFYYLGQHKLFKRTYNYEGNVIVVQFLDFLECDSNPNSKAALFGYKVNKDKMVLCKNIVCADGLTFAYNFEDL